MKRIIVLFTCILGISSLFAQTTFQNLTLAEALKKAGEEKKMVFVDCYTSWCGPCKIMADQILPQKEAGDFLNARFVCVKYDMEKGEGPQIARQYKVEAYPTFLLLNADGSLIQSILGMTGSAGEFVGKVKFALGEVSTTRMDSLYKSGNRMSRFVLGYLKALVVTEQYDKARQVSADLLNRLSDGEKSYATYWFIYDTPELSPIGSENVDYLLEHVDNFRKGGNEDAVNKRVASIFEVQLEDILRGRNKQATPEEVKTIARKLQDCHLPDSGHLCACATMAESMILRDAESALKAYIQAFLEMSDEKLSYLYFYPIIALKGKWNDEQKKELTKLTLKLSERAKKQVLKDGLKHFAESMIPNL